MKHLDTADRKNVNVLGEDDLALVVGGWGGRGHGQHGGSGGMNRRGGGGMSRRGGGQGRGQGRAPQIVVVFVAPGGVFINGDNSGGIDTGDIFNGV